MPYSALSYALYLLKNRAQTRRQLVEKLERKKYSQEEITEVLVKLEEMKLIDDESFARNYVRDKVVIYRRGPWRIRRELSQKGIDKTVINQAVEKISHDDELVAARSLAAGRKRLWQDLEPRKRSLRLVSLLTRRGFNAQVVKTVLEENK